MRILLYKRPCVIAVSCNFFCVLIDNCNDIALKILSEVVRYAVVDNTADTVLIVVHGYKCSISVRLAEYLCSVKSIGMLDTAVGLACSDSVCVIGVA